MRWWRRRRTRGGVVPAGQIIRQRRAESALAEAEKTLAEVKARRPEVEAQASALRGTREANHFAELITRVLGGQP